LVVLIYCFTVAVLACHHEFDLAVALPLLVQVLKRRSLLAALFQTDEWSTWATIPIFYRLQKCFGVQVVVTDTLTCDGP
jgi:hypothetical protein